MLGRPVAAAQSVRPPQGDDPRRAGTAGDLIHSLTRFRDLTVIVDHSALRPHATAGAPRQIAERLGEARSSRSPRAVSR
jgi:hypothetical protein